MRRWGVIQKRKRKIANRDPNGTLLFSLKEDIVRDGVRYLVSTVLLDGGEYETMVFRYLDSGKVRFYDLFDACYDTEALARQGHQETVDTWEPSTSAIHRLPPELMPN